MREEERRREKKRERERGRQSKRKDEKGRQRKREGSIDTILIRLIPIF